MNRKRAGVITGIAGLRASEDGRKMDGESSGVKRAFCTLNLKVQVRLRGIARIAASGDRLSAFYKLSLFHPDAAGHQMGQEGIFRTGGRSGDIASQICMPDQHIVSPDVTDERVGSAVSQDHAVRAVRPQLLHNAVCGSKDCLAVAVVAFTGGRIAPEAFSFLVQDQKIVCISLGIDLPGMRGLLAYAAVDSSPGAFKGQAITDLRRIIVLVRHWPVLGFTDHNAGDLPEALYEHW